MSKILASGNSSILKHLQLSNNAKIPLRFQLLKHEQVRQIKPRMKIHSSTCMGAKRLKNKGATFPWLPSQCTDHWGNRALLVFPLNSIQPLPQKLVTRLEAGTSHMQELLSLWSDTGGPLQLVPALLEPQQCHHSHQWINTAAGPLVSPAVCLHKP